MELRSALQAVVIEHKLAMAIVEVTAELRHRGFVTNHKRVVRLMRLDNLLALSVRRLSLRLTLTTNCLYI
jgi:transposase InsO family protein